MGNVEKPAMEIQFLGAAREVTGSCYLVRAGYYRILVDCGLIQGSKKDEARNQLPFEFNPAEIDAVVLTHAHLDHSGRLPLLIKNGFRGVIYTHRATRDLCRIMLKDAAYLNEKDIEWQNRKRQRKHLPLVEPLYTMDDVQQTLRQFKALDYGVTIPLLPGVSIRLADAGHILGSAIVELWLEMEGARRKIVFSGDLGHRDAPILQDPQPVREADLVVMESTYGDRLHRSWEQTWDELRDVLMHARHNQGNVLIPAFAVGRTQELLYEFGRHYAEWGLDDWLIFLDSPMAIETTEVYARHTGLYDTEAAAEQRVHGNPFTMLPNLHISRTASQSMAINRINAGAIIIAGSGMCDGGRIRHHLKHNLWRSGCHVVIVGFQASGTPGRALVDGAQYLRVAGETVRVAAQVHTIGGLSAHADADGLIDWYHHFEGRPAIALVHGEPQAMDPLAERLRSESARHVYTPEHGVRLNLLDWTEQM